MEHASLNQDRAEPLPASSPASELVHLRPSVRSLALKSIEFLALHVLGLSIPQERCAALQTGDLPRSTAERRAVIVFHALRRGHEPEGLTAVERYFLVA